MIRIFQIIDLSRQPCPRMFLLLILCAALPSCQSSGQESHDESDYFSRRKIPEYVMTALPEETDTLLQTDYFLFLGHGEIDSNALKLLAECSSGNTETLLEFARGKKQPDRIEWHLYPSPEIKGLMLKNSTPSQINHEELTVHSVLNDNLKLHYHGKENELLLRQLLGEPASLPLEVGLALHFAGDWQGYGYRFWAQRLHAGNSLPPLTELFNQERWQSCSPIIFGSAAASFCEFLIGKWGQEAFLDKYADWAPTSDGLASLETEWKQYLNKKTGELWTGKLKTPISYLQGFNFAHEGYRVFNGYGSRQADQALQHLTTMGANAVAIVPYSFLRNAKRAAHIPVVRHTGSENDESVIQSAESAQALGLNVMMKPQIWLGGGQWPGDIEMSSEQEWSDFFHCYNHWIVHYAVLAELYGWESLCIGTEMVRTTLKREADWRRIIQNIRQVYSGQLTYAANWGEEFEKTKIWDELDFIGLNCYYPLSQKDEPSIRDLRRGFAKVMDKIERVHTRFQKPIVFTEIGFPNIEAPWKKPHQDWGDFTPNEEHQRKCYEVVFEAIQDKEWCAGILWWKYPSDLQHRPRRSTGFSPHGKAAEATVEKWFSRSR